MPTTAKKNGITGFGAYVPRLRLQRAAIAAAHEWMAPGLRGLANGSRAFCSWDEDSVTMAVEAARDLFDGSGHDRIRRLQLASTTLPFADLQHSSLVAQALGLREEIQTQDLAHSQRAGLGGLIQLLDDGAADTLLITSDRPAGKPASQQEIGYGAGSAAFTIGADNVIAEYLASASRTAMLVDHFRPAQASFEYHWEERWVRDKGYLELVGGTVRTALDRAGISADQVHHFIVPSPLKSVPQALAKQLGIDAAAVSDNLYESCGYAGCAHGLLMLAHQLESVEPGAIIVLACLGLGVDALVLRTTARVSAFKPRRGVRAALADALYSDNYLRFLSYGGQVELEWGMRAEKSVKSALTEQYRSNDQLASFVAGRCSECGTVQFPQLQYCVKPDCNAPRAAFVPHSLCDEAAQVLTMTVDRLTWHPSPPLYVGFVQFEQGARVLMEVVDVGKAGVDVGTPLRMVYRIKDIDSVRGYPRYFWKATPLAA